MWNPFVFSSTGASFIMCVCVRVCDPFLLSHGFKMFHQVQHILKNYDYFLDLILKVRIALKVRLQVVARV